MLTDIKKSIRLLLNIGTSAQKSHGLLSSCYNLITYKMLKQTVIWSFPTIKQCLM